jgi:lipopolysaccharide/colanic/teichoic acid biosynthesis glycosyltransferase
MIKRLFDFLTSAAALAILVPVMLLPIMLLIKLTSRGTVFFKQKRVGKSFRLFRIYKFRTMVPDAPALGGVITIGDDPRITKVGRILRKTKLDELPQLFNVLIGDMSLVGPRPEAPKYVEMFKDDYREILKVRPGITDLASIKYRDESAILGCAEDPEEEYVKRILPEKIRFAKLYARRASLWFDLVIIFKTVLLLLSDRLPKQDKTDSGES